MEKVFSAITEQTNYTFAYSQPTINPKALVSLNVTDADLKNALNQLFAGTNVSFEIKDKKIFLTDKGSAAQQKPADKITVKGVVKDDMGEPLLGASVSEKGTTNAVMTDLNGNFTMRVAPNATLVFTYVGFNTQEAAVGGRTTMNMVLVENSKILDEVVVTALGIKREAKALGYSVAEVKSEALTAGRSDNAVNALSGKMAGVDISTGSGGPAGSTRVIIRGVSQLTGNNQPLYVIDGVPMDNTSMGSAGVNGGYDLGDGLSSINPDDIESMSVLKGASASALYGSRASNGVILITTKTGKGQKGLGIDVSMNVTGVKILSGFDDYQREYGQGTSGVPSYLASSAQTSTQSAWGGKLDPSLTFPIYNGEMKSYGNRNDNILSFFRTGITYNNSVAVSNNSEKGNFRVSVSDMRNKDIVPSSNMYRTTVMMKGDYNVTKDLYVEARANYSREKVNNRPALSDSPNNIGNSIIGIAPNFDQKWLAEGYKDEFGRYSPWNGNQWRLNPYWVINEMQNRSNKERTMGHVMASYKILPYLSVQGRVGIDDYKFRFTDYTPRYTDGRTTGEMSETSTTVSEINYEGLIRFNKRFLDDKLDVSAFVGANMMQYKMENIGNKGTDQSLPDVVSIRNYNRYDRPSYTNLKKDVNSVFGSVSVGYNSFLYGEFTLRNDWSSTLPKDNNSYSYPSISGSFVFSEIANLSNIGLSFGKLRASWAKVGGDTSPYMIFNAYGLLDFTIGGSSLGTIASDVLPNQFLKPTSTYSHEIGLDLRFLNDRLNFDFGYYNQSTKNQIMNLPLTSSAGYTAAIINTGEISNKGVELAITAIPVRIKDFEWMLNVNLAHNKNRMEKLHDDVKIYELSAARWAGASVVAKEGESFGSIMGKKFARNENGDVIFTEDGMPTFENEVSVLGNGNHDLTLGVGSTFRYKDFSLGVLFDMKFGADIYSMSYRMAHYNGTSKNTLEGRREWNESEEARRAANATLENWTPTGGYVGKGVVDGGLDENGNTIWMNNTTPVDPQVYWRSVADNTPEPFILDASYVKLRELNFTYNFPLKLLARTPIKGLSLSAYGRNLFILHSKLKNIDPESNYNNGNGQGLEYGSLPSRRTFGFGVNVKF
ncbi:SusC/RagA family TonB-linked outer membrane protein [Dysgonomonas sp. 511]|uniref:SusC/RagA family TonB-linked outer membrane protein n=1 Tax=Dysgonomonas sp. 511 TaxID=2302930 RepID=UPI0013D3EAC9|nr:SusC/RagA family TonB-linked outer membrane protein [Dysgonomonas sp. 511]